MEGFRDSAFWDYSWVVYHRKDVPGICIDLQETYGADVNMLLLGCWLANTGRGVLTVADWSKSLQHISEWRNEVVKPLRHVRKYIKAYAEANAPATLYQHILDSEISAERVEQLILEQLWQALPPTDSAITRQVEVSVSNILNYLAADELDINDALEKHVVALLCGIIPRATTEQVQAIVSSHIAEVVAGG